jgi:hypothetical protein
MDRFEGRCHLDWWANPITCLARVEITLAIAVTDMGWTAEGRLASDNHDEREGFALLLDMDPVFTLRFDDESTIEVTVHPGLEGDRFTLTEYTGSEG